MSVARCKILKSTTVTAVYPTFGRRHRVTGVGRQLSFFFLVFTNVLVYICLLFNAILCIGVKLVCLRDYFLYENTYVELIVTDSEADKHWALW